MINSEVYNQILDLADKALLSDDETEKELLMDLAEAAYRYTGFRMMDNFYNQEKRNEQGAARTSCHNHYMDTLVIFLRYEKSLGREVPEPEMERKSLGDIGNQLVADLAIRQR